MVHNQDTQSISQSIQDVETVINKDKWEPADEKLSTFRSQKESPIKAKTEDCDFAQISNIKNDITELLKENQTKSEEGSKSQITINSGNSIR